MDLPTLQFQGKRWAKIAKDFEKHFSEWRRVPWDGTPYFEERRTTHAIIPEGDPVCINDQLVTGKVLVAQVRKLKPDNSGTVFFQQTMIIDLPESKKVSLNHRMPFHFEGDPLSLEPEFACDEEEE